MTDAQRQAISRELNLWRDASSTPGTFCAAMVVDVPRGVGEVEKHAMANLVSATKGLPTRVSGLYEVGDGQGNLTGRHVFYVIQPEYSIEKFVTSLSDREAKAMLKALERRLK